MKDRRVGRFSLSRHLIDECPDQVRAALRDVIVIRAEYMGYRDAVEYDAIHPSFAATPDGSRPQEYLPEITVKGDGTVQFVKWKPI